jgi:hypothetical protein
MLSIVAPFYASQMPKHIVMIVFAPPAKVCRQVSVLLNFFYSSQTLSIKGTFATLSITTLPLCLVFRFIFCYAECHHAEYCGSFLCITDAETQCDDSVCPTS